jgi:hypothetical protein
MPVTMPVGRFEQNLSGRIHHFIDACFNIENMHLASLSFAGLVDQLTQWNAERQI